MLLSGATASFLRELYLSEAPFSALVENDMVKPNPNPNANPNPNPSPNPNPNPNPNPGP